MCAKWIESEDEVTVAPYCSLGECQLRVTARAESVHAALEKVYPVVRALTALLGESVYAVLDTSEGSMEEAAGRELTAKGLTFATAES